MTTPNQSPPDGSYILGGGEWKYGQELSESHIGGMFMPAIPTNPVEALGKVKEILRQAPPGSLSGLSGIVPGLDEESVDSELASERVNENLTSKRPFLDLLDRIVSKVSGNDEIENSTLDDVRDAFAKMISDLSNNTRSIQELMARDAGEVATGSVVNIDFGNYPDGPIPPELFKVTYLDDRFPSPGTAEIGIQNGLAQFVTRPGDGPRDVMLTSTQPTETHFQIARGTMAVPPMDPVDGQAPKFHALLRVSEDEQTYVWARAWNVGSWFQFRGEIGITIDGVETIWETDIPLTWALDMTAVAGVGNNPHQYQVWSGKELVVTYTDELEMCPLPEDDNFGWGSIAQIRGKNHSGKVGGCSVADNLLPATIGTNAMMYRTSTSNEMMTGGDVIRDFPANFFQIVGRTSRDIETDPADGSFTISKDGMYVYEARVELSVGLNSKVHLVMKVNGFPVDIDAGITPSNGEAMKATFTAQHLEAGDKVTLSYIKAGGNLGVLTGEATGLRTYVSIYRIPDPLPLDPVEAEES